MIEHRMFICNLSIGQAFKQTKVVQFASLSRCEFGRLVVQNKRRSGLILESWMLKRSQISIWDHHKRCCDWSWILVHSHDDPVDLFGRGDLSTGPFNNFIRCPLVPSVCLPRSPLRQALWASSIYDCLNHFDRFKYSNVDKQWVTSKASCWRAIIVLRCLSPHAILRVIFNAAVRETLQQLQQRCLVTPKGSRSAIMKGIERITCSGQKNDRCLLV